MICRLCGCGGQFHLDGCQSRHAYRCQVAGLRTSPDGSLLVDRARVSRRGPAQDAQPSLHQATSEGTRKQDLGELSKTGRMSPGGLRIHPRTLSGRQCTPLISHAGAQAVAGPCLIGGLPIRPATRGNRAGWQAGRRAGRPHLSDRCAGSHPAPDHYHHSLSPNYHLGRAPSPRAGFNAVIVREAVRGFGIMLISACRGVCDSWLEYVHSECDILRNDCLSVFLS